MSRRSRFCPDGCLATRMTHDGYAIYVWLSCHPRATPKVHRGGFVIRNYSPRAMWTREPTTKTRGISKLRAAAQGLRGDSSSCQIWPAAGSREQHDRCTEAATSPIKQFRTEFIPDERLVFACLEPHKAGELAHRHWSDFGTRSRKRILYVWLFQDIVNLLVEPRDNCRRGAPRREDPSPQDDIEILDAGGFRHCWYIWNCR